MSKAGELLEKIGWYRKYTEKCKNCGEENHAITQEDCHPEYYTDVYVECKKCEHMVMFELPVN